MRYLISSISLLATNSKGLKILPRVSNLEIAIPNHLTNHSLVSSVLSSLRPFNMNELGDSNTIVNMNLLEAYDLSSLKKQDAT